MICSSIYDGKCTFRPNSKFHQVGGKSYDNYFNTLKASKKLVDYSKAHNEPSWMTELRKKALKLTETLQMPKPDKQN